MEAHGPYIGLGGNGWRSNNRFGRGSPHITTDALSLPANNALPASFGDGSTLKGGCDQVGWFRSEFGCV